MIRVLFTIPNFNTAGSGKALLNLALRLDKQVFEVHIACKTNEGKFFEEVEKSGLPVHIFNYEAPMRPLSALLVQSLKIAKRLNTINPDIIHSFHYNNNYGEAIPVLLGRSKWVFTKKNMNWGGDGANSWKLRSFFASKIVIQNAEMRTQFYPKSKKTVLIERGIWIEQFLGKGKDVDVFGQMNTPHNARVVISVANLLPVKGITHLIEAFHKLVAMFPEWYLWIVGDDTTKEGKRLKEYVDRNNISSKVIFAGKQHNVSRYLDQAEIFVLPTKSVGEGSPVALIEAMANGKVVCGSAVPGISGQLKTYPQNLFIPEDTHSLQECLKQLMKNSSEQNERLGSQFSKYAKENYSISKEVKAHEILYKSLKSN